MTTTKRTAKATPATLFLAELSTRSFTFHAIGTTEAKAREAMRRTWEAHRAQYARSVLNPVVTWAEISGDGDSLNVFPITPDAIGIRDGEAIR